MTVAGAEQKVIKTGLPSATLRCSDASVAAGSGALESSVRGGAVDQHNKIMMHEAYDVFKNAAENSALKV
jgi:hypothetical protein